MLLTTCDEKSVDVDVVEAKSDKILSDTLMTLDDAIRNAKPEKKRSPEGENLQKEAKWSAGSGSAGGSAGGSGSASGGKTKARENSKTKDSKNCCRHFENSSRCHKSKASKVVTENASQQTQKPCDDNDGKDDDNDSLIGSQFIPDHVKSLIPERV